MTSITLMFDTDDPDLRPLLAEINRMHGPQRLRMEAGLCQWWANRALEQAGAIDHANRMDASKTARARATRQAKAANKSRGDMVESTTQ